MKNTEKNTDKKQQEAEQEANTNNEASTTEETVEVTDTVDTAESQDTEPDAPEANETTQEPAAAAAPQAEPAQSKQGATWPGKLALVLSLVALGGSGYLYWQSMQTKQQNQAAFDDTIKSLKTDVSNAVSETKEQLATARSSVDAQVKQVNSNLNALQSASTQEKQSIAELQERLTQSIQQVMAKQSNTRKDWLLAEVEYLLRLANQRILMENTSVGALALLKSADKILKETDDVSIYAVRKALASDIASLEAVPTFDLEGSYLKLAALNEQVDNLRILPLTDKNKLPSLIEEITPESVSESWTQGLKESWAKATDKLEKLVVIQHRDEQVEPLMSPEQTYYLQQNLHLMLEQAQLALLQKEQNMFDKSLAKAEQWVSTYFDQKDPTTQALLRGLGEIKTLQISPELPNISSSLSSLKSYLQQMTKLKEEGAS